MVLALLGCATFAKATPAKIAEPKVVEIEKKTETNEAKRLTTEAFELYRAGKAEKSLPLFLKALNIRREQQGEKHPETLKSLHRYATALVAAGRGSEAEKLFVKALKLKRKVLGPKHRDTIAGIGNLAATIEENGRAEEAEPLHAEALQLRKESTTQRRNKDWKEWKWK